MRAVPTTCFDVALKRWLTRVVQLLAVVLLAQCGREQGLRERLLAAASSSDVRCSPGRFVGQVAHSDYSSGCAADSASAARLGTVLPDELVRDARRLSLGGKEPGDLGLFDLHMGDIDRAVKQFEIVVARDPNPDALADVSAAYLARAGSAGQVMDLLLAVDSSLRALQLDRTHATAAFNYATALGRLHLPGTANRAWARFLELEKPSKWWPRLLKLTSPWADEARERQRLLVADRSDDPWARTRIVLLDRAELPEDQVATLVVGHPYQARRLCELEIPHRWAIATLADDTALADFWLRRWLQIARPLASKVGVWLPLDEAERLMSVRGDDGRAAVLREEAERWLALAEAGTEYERLNYERAQELLGAVLPALARANSPLAFFAEVQLAVSYYNGNVPGAVDRLEELLDRIPDRYPSVRGKALWMLGIAAGSERRFEDAIRHYSDALALVGSVSGPVRAATLQLLIADILDTRGELVRGWQRRIGVLETLSLHGEPRRRFGAALATAQALARHGRPTLALVFLDEAELTLEEYKLAAAGAELHLERAGILLQEGELEVARRELAFAASYVERVEAGDLQLRLDTNLAVLQAVARIDVDAAKAAESLRRAYKAHSDSGYRFGEIEYLFSLARALLAAGDRDGAKRELKRAVQAYEDTRLETVGLGSQIEAMRQAESVFDQLVGLSLADPDPAEAFQWLERGRAQTLAGRRSAGLPGRHPVSLDRLARELPRGTVLVEYAFQGHELLAWTISRNQPRFQRLSITRAELERSVSVFVHELESAGRNSGSSNALAEYLYDRLLAPLELDLETTERLVVVPEGVLWTLPFSALLDSRSGKYVIEQAAVVTTPSARLLLNGRVARQSRAASRPLVVASSGPDTGPYRSLPRLRFVEREAGNIASSMVGATVLLGAKATVDGMLEMLPSHSMLHYAGHAISSRSSWHASGLILTPSNSWPDGYLDAGSISLLDLSELDLVVLSGCRTLTGYDGGREGTFSLGVAFYLAGAGSVIGSYWNVEDEQSSRLMTSVYQELKETDSPASALRRAAIQQIDRSRETGIDSMSWAAFAVLGD